MNSDLVYEEITDSAMHKDCMCEYLREYNNLPGVVSMDLVLFRDAMDHGMSCDILQPIATLCGTRHRCVYYKYNII